MRWWIILLHIAFWGTLFFLFTWVHTHFVPLTTALAKVAANFSLFVVTFYLHCLLINKLLERRKIILYSFTVLILLLVSTMGKHLFDLYFSTAQMPVQRVIAKQVPLLAPFLFMLFWILFSLFYQLLVNRYHREQINMERLREFTSSQNQLLKNQINPHFLFNNLNNLYSLILTKSPNAAESVLKLSDLLRYTVYKSGNEWIKLTEELEQVQNLIALYQLKEAHLLNVQQQIDGDISSVLLEPMLLLPLVENCFKHGDILLTEKAFIHLSVRAESNHLFFEVRNSMGVPNQQEPGGFGLANLRQRLKLAYGPDARLITSEQNGIFTVQLHVSWKNKSDVSY